MKTLGAEVEKIASNDPKTLAQAAAIAALSKTKDKKYLPIFEKGINAVSEAVKEIPLVQFSQLILQGLILWPTKLIWKELQMSCWRFSFLLL